MNKIKINKENDLFSADTELNIKSEKSNNQRFKPEMPYHFIIERFNLKDSIGRAVLFGHEYYSKTINYGSSTDIIIKSADTSIDYLKLLNQWLEGRFRAKGIKIIADSWDIMPKSLFYKDIKLGEYQVVSLVDDNTWGEKVVLDKAVNNIPLSKIIIEGGTKIILDIYENSKIEVLIY